MKFTLMYKNLIIFISIITLLNSSSFVETAKKEKNYKDTYGVQLVLGR